MSRIIELREKQARIHANAQSKLNEITDSTPEDRAAEINREFDAMLAEFDKIGEQIEREQKIERVLTMPRSARTRRTRAARISTAAPMGRMMASP